MSDLSDRLARLAPSVDHDAARAHFDRTRRRRRRRRTLAGAAAAMVVVVAGIVTALAVAGDGDRTPLVTAGDGTPAGGARLAIPIERPDGTTLTAEAYVPATPEEGAVCVVFPFGAVSCGGSGGRLPSPVGGERREDTDGFVALVGPASATRLDVVATTGTVTAEAHVLAGDAGETITVAVADVTGIGQVTALEAFDGSGTSIARNDDGNDLDMLNRWTRLGTAAVPTTCGSGLPSGFERADGGPLASGHAPGAMPALFGQTVVHWTSDDVEWELRWPATPQPPYGDEVHDDAALPSPAISTARTGDGGLVLDVSGGGLGAGAPDLRFRQPSAAADPGCIVEVTAWSQGVRTRLGLRFVDDPALDVELVDLDPVVAATRPGPAPTTPAGCDSTGHRNRSGAGDERPQDDAVGALMAFLDTDPADTFPRSAWTEFTVDADTVVYAWETQPGSDEYAVIVGTERNAGGWRVVRWQSSGC